MEIRIIKPIDCNDQELTTFFEIVISGRQVTHYRLKERINAADFLAFYIEENQILGVASIKNPNINYKEDVFNKAKVKHLASNYKYEIGYAVTKEEYRGRKISQQLIKSLIDNSNSNSFFATTKVDDMRHILEKMKFEKLGDSYKNGKGEILYLYHFKKVN